MAATSTEDEILHLSKQGKWEEIVDGFGRNRFLPWIWPEKRNLEFIKRWVEGRGSDSLISVGCGSGLLEWLLEKATGLRVVGIKIDGVWWKSNHSPGTFIPLSLAKDPNLGEFPVETNNSVLLFCYFNDLRAFLNYLDHFRGNCFIVIGPGTGRGTYTIPEPFHLPENVAGSWLLIDHQEIGSSKDFIAVYIRK